jgi:hypothetical protein
MGRGDVVARRAAWAFGLVLLLGASLLVGYGVTAAHAHVVAADGGLVVDPMGALSVDDDGRVLIAYPGRQVARFSLRLRVRNTSRLSVRVTSHEDVAVPDLTGWPTRSFELGPHETGWLSVVWDDHGCPGVKPGLDGAWTTVGSIAIRVDPKGWSPHVERLELPFALKVPQVELPVSCYPEIDPTAGPEDL